MPKKTLPKVVEGGDCCFWEALRTINGRTRGAENGRISSSGAVYEGSPNELFDSSWSSRTLSSYGKRSEKEKNWEQEVVRLLDAACGIKRMNGKRYVGRTLTTYMGCKALPVYLVRPVEVECVARRLNCTEMDIGRVHNFLGQLSNDSKDGRITWDLNDVLDKKMGCEYLMRATLTGNKFAKRVLEWMAPVKAKDIVPTLGAAHAEYIRAINSGQRRLAIQMGTMVAGGETGKAPIRPDHTFVLAMPAHAREAMSANNIGYMLLHGLGGVNRNVEEAIKYFETAIKLGSAAGASNLGHVYFSGANGGVVKDGQRAKQLYMLAVERGERSSAPRNLAVLLLRGAPGLRSDMQEAVRWLLLGLREGDNEARGKCEKTLRLTMRSWRFVLVNKAMKRDCFAALHELKWEKMETLSKPTT